MTYRAALSAGAIALFTAAPAAAHHPGSTANTGTAGPINTISASTIEQGHYAVALMYEYISLGGLTDAALIDAASKHIHAHSIKTIQSPSLGAAYGVTDDFMVAFRLPYVLRTDIREGHHEHVHGGAVLNTVDFRGDSAGIGDLTVMGQWRLPKNPVFGTEWAVLFGVKAPTGRTDVFDDLGNLFEAEFQPGSGSWDILVGLAVTQRIAAWSFDANVMYVNIGTGTQDTDLGDRFQYNAAVSYRAIGWNNPADPMNAFAHVTPNRKGGARHSHGKGKGHSHDHGPEPAPAPQFALDLVLELNGEWHDKQVAAGVVDPNSGGNVLYLSPGIRASYGMISGFASIGIPIVNNLNGLQSEPDYRVLAGTAASF